MNKELSKIYDPKLAEKKWQNFWEKEKIYAFDPGSKKPIFSVDTPPPYISADSLHVGHAMSYAQAEIIIRYRRMRGENIFYPMGFDDNGLPTERYVEKKYKIDKSKITRKEFVDLCLKETAKGGKMYESLWRSLGLSVDWSLLYSTISPLAQKISQRSFIDLFRKKRIYRKNSPTFWCTRCQTALAQADLEDKEEKSFMYDIRFAFEDGQDAIISTTRPELIPACVALYVNPKDPRYKSRIGKTAIAPVTGDKIPVKASDTVEMEKGTGLMMVCTWGDVEDITKWKENKLETKLIIEKNGKLNKKAGKFAGLTLVKAREEILGELKNKKLIADKKEIIHVLNIHERCKHPVDFFVSPQWFVKVLDIKEDLKKRGNELSWYPEFMKIHLDNWIDGLKWDWCISRERYYGVPFPVWYCQNCGEIILPEDGDLPVDPRESKFKNVICKKCGSQKIIGEMQVMDTWMTSSVTPLINARWQEKDSLISRICPMNLRVQAFEIIRTWLFYTLVKSHLHTKNLPWKSVMISGWGLAKNGEKMSKSLNNFIMAESIIKKYGADALRHWSCGATLGMNLRFNEEDVKAGQKLLTKFWNAARFIIMNLEDYDCETIIYSDELETADQWILAELQKLTRDVTAEFEQYEFARAKTLLEHFFWIKFTDNYIELVKSRLYGENKAKKGSAQFTLFFLLSSLIKLFAPILPHITEELYQRFIKTKGSPKSVHILKWPAVAEKFQKTDLEEKSANLIEAISQMRKNKTEKNVKLYEPVKKIIINIPIEHQEFFQKIKEDLRNLAHAEKIDTAVSAKGKISVEIENWP